MKTLRFKYRGDDWNWYIAPEEEINHLAEDAGTPQFVEVLNKEVYIQDNYELNLRNVLHELWHVAFSYRYIETANLDSHQTEEISQETFSFEGPMLVELGTKMLRALQDMKKLPSIDQEWDLDKDIEKGERK